MSLEDLVAEGGGHVGRKGDAGGLEGGKFLQNFGVGVQAEAQGCSRSLGSGREARA